ncbi:MAG: hypothetical protein ACT4PV_10530 [Planctomycetaceae bacterium]
MACGCQDKRKPAGSAGCECDGSPRGAGHGTDPASGAAPVSGPPHVDRYAELASNNAILAAVLRERTIYRPPRELLARMELRPTGGCEPVRGDALLPRRVVGPLDAGLRLVAEPLIHQPAKSAPNLYHQVLAPLWVHRYALPVAAPTDGALECDPCAPIQRPPRSLHDCALQSPAPNAEARTQVEPPQVQQLDDMELDDECSACGMPALGARTIRMKSATLQVPHPMCHDARHGTEDEYTPFVPPERPSPRGKGGVQPLACPCTCTCVVNLAIVGLGRWPEESAASEANRLHELLDAAISAVTRLTSALLPTRGVMSPPHTYTSDRGNPVLDLPALASGYAPQRMQLEQGAWIGAGANSGWEISVGVLSPPRVRETPDVISHGGAIEFEAPLHPDSSTSINVGVLSTMPLSSAALADLLPPLMRRPVTQEAAGRGATR